MSTAKEKLYQRYCQALSGKALPLAFLDMDSLDRNAEHLLQLANGLPIRLASKSLRSVGVLRYLLKKYKGFQGLMTFSAKESALLCAQGFDDILIAYPTMEGADIRACLPAIAEGKRLIFMVDHREQLKLLQGIAQESGLCLNFAFDLDLSTRFPGLHFGVYRSPLNSLAKFEDLCRFAQEQSQLRCVGLMGYEAQLAGLGDQIPGRWIYSQLILWLKKRSQSQAFARRQQCVRKLQEQFPLAKLVNGGGSGSLKLSRSDPSLSEVTAGSGLYAPHLFDLYRDLTLSPALFFALTVVREYGSGIYALSGGGYIASGSVNADKQPQLYLPEGLEAFSSLGFGEVQTSLRATRPLQLGQAVILRHAKAGELLERFSEIHLLRGEVIESTELSYRGESWQFF